MFTSGKVQGAVIMDLVKFTDDRGWLMELFRQDEVDPVLMPVMGYISATRAGVARGPHEHTDQTDFFAFLGPSNFKIYMWDNRKTSPTFMTKQVVYAGEDAPRTIVIPPGVVHAYKNIGKTAGMVVNFPNRLYAGWGKKDPVDEIRHEQNRDTPFQLD
jgi:dTDP-4-dehydrorhamnose 3,5-epimerase